MSMDLSEFHDIFFEECNEGLVVMETGLLSLDNGTDVEEINSIFRAAHSIKGGAGSFGFMGISEFTHLMETLLDEMRDGRRCVTQNIVDLLLQSVDILRDMVTAAQEEDEADEETIAEVKVNLDKMLESSEGKEAAEDDTGDEGVVEKEITITTEDESHTVQKEVSEVNQNISKWKIVFKPDAGMMQGGNDPIRIFTELKTFGELKVLSNTSDLAVFDNFDPKKCYISWNLELASAEDLDVIQDAFSWVEGQCTLEINSIEDSSENSVETKAVKEEKTKTDNIESAPEVKETKSAEDKQSEDKQSEDKQSEDQQSEDQQSEDQPADAAISALKKSETENTDSVFEVEESTPVVAKKPEAKPVEMSIPAPKREKPPAKPVAKAKAKGGAAKESGSIRVSIDKVDALINMVGELVITQSMLSQTGESLEPDNPGSYDRLLDGLTQLERNTRELQGNVLQIRMLPISFAFSRFPRLVRDLSKTLGKIIDIEMIGENTEVDKTVLEKINDPLVHLVRNSLDHGIETPGERKSKGKSEKGTLQLRAYHEGSDIVIQVSDDGAGLNRDVILDKAIEKGLVGANEELPDDRVFNLIFMPGFSTAEQLSDVSGRGVGMDVVRRNVRDLGGNVSISNNSSDRPGSTVTIRLPLTLAILDGQLVRVGEETYIVSLIAILESMQMQPEFINTIANASEVYRLRDEYLPVIRLKELFEVGSGTDNLQEGLLVVVESDGRKIGLFVDDLLGQQQVVIKNLESNFKQIQGISGATILGDGTVALIMDVPGLIQKHFESKRGKGDGQYEQAVAA